MSGRRPNIYPTLAHCLVFGGISRIAFKLEAHIIHLEYATSKANFFISIEVEYLVDDMHVF